MKTSKIYATIVLATLTILINSCKKNETGPAGKDGSANVTATVFTASSWTYSSPYYYINLSVPELTSTNINSAAVMVYFNKNNGSWVAVPFTQYNSPSNYFMGFNTSTGNVQVTWAYDSSLSSGSNPNAYYGATVSLKVVVIPPSMIKLYPNIDLRNYSEVRETFNLKD